MGIIYVRTTVDHLHSPPHPPSLARLCALCMPSNSDAVAPTSVISDVFSSSSNPAQAFAFKVRHQMRSNASANSHTQGQA